MGNAAPELRTLATCEQSVACDRASLQEHRHETETSPSFLRRTTGIQEPSEENEEAWISSVLHGDIQVFQMLVGRRSMEENHERKVVERSQGSHPGRASEEEGSRWHLVPWCPSSDSKWALLRGCPPRDIDPGKAIKAGVSVKSGAVSNGPGIHSMMQFPRVFHWASACSTMEA